MPERTFRKLSTSISLRIALPALATIALFILAIFFFLLPQLEESFMARKKETIKELTETVWSLLESYHEREMLGELSREEAQKRAILRIHTLRYGEEQKDYFWINDMVPVLIMHPYRSDLEGTDVGGFTDPKGKHLFREFVEVVQDRGPAMWSICGSGRTTRSRSPQRSPTSKVSPHGAGSLARVSISMMSMPRSPPSAPS